jgi:hypothetical protein
MKLRKTSLGNHFGYHEGFYIFIFRRPHGKWCCTIGRKGEWLAGEGYFGTYLSTFNKAKKWAKYRLQLLIDEYKKKLKG